MLGNIAHIVNEFENLDLNRLRQHNLVEHDASVVHRDSYQGANWIVDPSLLAEFLKTASSTTKMNGVVTKSLTMGDVSKWRKKRATDCANQNPQYQFNMFQSGMAYLEAAALFCVFGNGQIPVNVIATFLGKECLPDNFRPRADSLIEQQELVSVAFQIRMS